MTLRAVEADIVRDLASRVLAGESLASLTRWMNEQGIPTVTGKGLWLTGTVRGLLMSARISGQRSHRGEIIAKAVWPAIIAPEETDKLRALLTPPGGPTAQPAATSSPDCSAATPARRS